jgi:hypothetical protein
MVLRTSRVSRYERPDMLPESSIRKTVSKMERKEKSVSSIAVERGVAVDKKAVGSASLGVVAL